jgi:hypothetical protein
VDSSRRDLIFTLSGTAAPLPPSNQFSVGKLRRNKRKGTARLTVNVPGPGTLALGGKGVVAQRAVRSSPERRTARTVDAAGPVTLLIKAKGKAKRKLNRTGAVVLRLVLTFAPNGGTAGSQTKRVKLIKKP